MTATTVPTIHAPRARRVARTTALVAGAAMAAKVLLIIATGNSLPALLETVLFAVGALLPLVTAIAVATTRRGWPSRIGVGFGIAVAHLGYITMLSDGVGEAVAVFTDVVHLIDELPLLLLGAAWLAVGVRMGRSHE